MLTLPYEIRIEQLAKRKGISMAQVSLAWLLHKDGEYVGSHEAALLRTAISGVTAPVVGASSEAKLHDLLGVSFPCLWKRVEVY